MQKIIGKINIENILCIFIMISPILDIISFIFRNTFETRISPVTIVRPIIPIIVMLYLFLKKDKKFKLYSILIAFLYVIYGIIHILLFKDLKTGMSYSNELHEMQYLINYSFMILNLFIYTYVFKNKNVDKLQKSVCVSSFIAILSIYIAMITQTSSHTYIEESIGYKGWFESGNSVSGVLVLSIFVYISLLKDEKYRKIVLLNLILVGIYLTTLIGTRVGIYGYIIVVTLYIVIEIIYNLIKNKKINKKIIACSLFALTLLIIIITLFGSSTMKRRNYLKDIEGNIVDNSTNQEAHITGSLLEIKEKIDNNMFEENFMSEEQKKSIKDLYEIAHKYKIKNNDQRTQQLIYNIQLVKNQDNPMLILFGNGYMANYRELVLEMEVLAILLNFGIIGFILYLLPFISVIIYAIYKGMKNPKLIDKDYIFLICGCLFAMALSLFSGYIFFNVSVTLIVIVLNTMLLNKCTRKEI